MWVSRGCLVGLSRVPCWNLEGVLSVFGGCHEGVWRVFCYCLEGVLYVSGGCLVGVWRVSIVPPFHESIAINARNGFTKPSLHVLGMLLYKSSQCKI